MAIRSGGAPLNTASGIREFARSTPGQIAVIDGDRSLTFAQLDERSNRLACALLGMGLGTGDRVGVLLHNRAEYLELTAATSKSGLVLVPLNPRGTRGDVDHILGAADIRCVVVESALQELLPEDPTLARIVVGSREAAGDADYEHVLERARPVDPNVIVAESEPFTIVFTSGTTGPPKGVVLSHRARVLTFYASALEWSFGQGARSVAVAPMYHGAGLSYSYGPVFCGGSVTIMRRWDPEKFLRTVERDRATTSFLVPTHAHMFRALGEDTLRTPSTATLRTLFFNAAALPVATKHWVLDSLPHVGVHELYGSTEAGVVANLRPVDAARKAGSVGTPWLLNEARLVDDEGNPVPPGEPGELFSRSPFLMNGYLDNPEATEAATTADGFFSAGDVAVSDDEGYLSIIDRKKDMIVTGGVNVYPREIEELIAEHPLVAEAAVVGLPDAKWGEVITAFVVLRERVAVDQESAHIALVAGVLPGRLADYKFPRNWRVVEELPRSAAGKILKRELRAAQHTASR